MNVLTKDRAVVVRNRGVVVGSCQACCAPATGCPWYYRYVPCVVNLPHECGFAAAPVGEIYVGATLRCRNGGRLCDFPLPTGLPVIRWGGWCWRPDFSGPCTHYVVPGTTNLPTLPPGQAYCPLPCDAIGPAGPELECFEDCTAAACSGPAYIFLKRCPGQPGGGEIPRVYICGYQIAPSLAAGIRCPAVNIAGICYVWDWANAASSLPAGYSQYPGVGTWIDGCCACQGGDCTTSDAVVCPGLVGSYPQRCCAHATLGRSWLDWSFTESVTTFGNTTTQTWRGTAARIGGVVTGFVTRTLPDGSTETGAWSTPTLGPFNIGNYGPSASGVFGAASSLKPCGIATSCPATFEAVSTCYIFESRSAYDCVIGDARFRGASRVRYSVQPNGAACEGDCGANPQTGGPPANEEGEIVLPCLDAPPGGGDALPDWTAMLEALR